MPNTSSAVKLGRNTWWSPARNSLTPTPQNVNHLPTRPISAAASGSIDVCAATESSGSTSISTMMAAKVHAEFLA